MIDDGDVLMVSRLDRLARSTRDLVNILDALTKRGAAFRSLGDSWADTTTPHGRLMLTVLGGLAEFERELIRARTGEGRTRAVARGQHMAARPNSPLISGARRCRRLPATAPIRPIRPAASTSAKARFRGCSESHVIPARAPARQAGDRRADRPRGPRFHAAA